MCMLARKPTPTSTQTCMPIHIITTIDMSSNNTWPCEPPAVCAHPGSRSLQKPSTGAGVPALPDLIRTTRGHNSRPCIGKGSGFNKQAIGKPKRWADDVIARTSDVIASTSIRKRARKQARNRASNAKGKQAPRVLIRACPEGETASASDQPGHCFHQRSHHSASARLPQFRASWSGVHRMGA
jgi:hypothetical protein